MKIISKIKDFYDYCENEFRDESFVLDRRKFYKVKDWLKLILGNKSEIEHIYILIDIGQARYMFYYGKDKELTYLYKGENFEKKKQPIQIYVHREWFIDKTKELVFEILHNQNLDLDKWSIQEEGSIPVFEGSAFVKYFNSRETYLSIYDYLRSLKTEENVPNNQTNKEKIVSHSFDLKTSFRGI